MAVHRARPWARATDLRKASEVAVVAVDCQSFLILQRDGGCGEHGQEERAMRRLQQQQLVVAGTFDGVAFVAFHTVA